MASAPLFYDRVMETSTTTGTGTYSLVGAVTGYQAFSAVGNGNSCFYCAEDVDANGAPNGGWEVGLGTYTSSGTTLSRDTIFSSSNSGSAVNWSAGTRRIMLVAPAQQLGPYGTLQYFTDPNLQSWSWVNQGTASVTSFGRTIYMDTGTASATDNLRVRVMTAPSTPYTITAALYYLMPQVDFMFGGLCFRESGSGKLATLCLKSHSADYANGFSWSAQKWTNPTTFSANYSLSGSLTKANNFGDNVVWMRIADDGTNRKLSISKDGQNFRQIHSVGRTDFLTADQVGFWLNANNATYGLGLTVASFRIN